MAGRPQAALTKAKAPNPYRAITGQRMLWGKISARHPETGRVDVTLDHGSILPNVLMGPQMLGQTIGETYLPAVNLVTPEPTAQGPYGLPTLPASPADNTQYVLVDWLEGSGREPVVVGYNPTTVSIIAPQKPGWKVFRHEAGYWETVDPDGNWTQTWPDGSTISVSTTGTPAQPTDINPQFPAPPATTPVQMTFQTAAGAKLIISGTTVTVTDGAGATAVLNNGVATITANTVNFNNGTKGVARLGDSVSGTTSNGDTFTGTITSASTTVLSG